MSGGTLSYLMSGGYPISGEGVSYLTSCLGVPYLSQGGTLSHLMFRGTLSHMREGPHFMSLGYPISPHVWGYSISSSGGTLSQVRDGPPSHVWGGTLSHLMFRGTLSQVREGPPFHVWWYLISPHVWGGTLSQVRAVSYLTSCPGVPYLR